MKLMIVAFLLAFCSSGWASGADFQKKIKAGEIVGISVPSSGVWPGRAMATIDAPAETVYKILNDFKSYHEYVPRVSGSRHLSGRNYRMKARFPWPVNEVNATLKVKSGKRGKVYVVKWKMTEGQGLSKYEGVAWIQPWGKNRSMLIYQMLAVPQIVAPNAVTTNGLRKATIKMVEALRKRTAKILAQR